MRSRVTKLVDALRSGYWFVPGVMAATAVLLSMVTVAIDRRFPTLLEEVGIGSGGVEGSRGLLETVAASMITVAGVSFSIAIVVMSLASSQFGPRLLRTFMRDRGNQLVLGVFVSTFLYCLLVMRTIRGEESGTPFVPHLSVSVSMLLTVTSLAFFIYFIHHAAQLIQVSHIIAAVGRDLAKVIDRVVPVEGPAPAGDRTVAALTPATGGRAVRADRAGYVQFIDHESLLKAAAERDLLVRLGVRAGSFVLPATRLAEVWSAADVDDGTEDAVRAAIVTGAERTEQQDIDFGFQQLEQIALRALSPAINDPFTAGICVDQLGVALCLLAERTEPARLTRDDTGRPRVIALEVTFAALLSSAFDDIRRSGRDIVYLLDRLLSTLARIAERAHRSADLAALREQVQMVRIAAESGSQPVEERLTIEAGHAAAIATIERRLAELSRSDR